METMKKISIDELIHHHETVSFDIVRTIDYAIKLEIDELKISKPFLKINANSDEALEYAQKLKQYEIDVVDINNQNRLISKYNDELYNTIIDFIKNRVGFYNIPELYQEKTFSYIRDKSDSLKELYYELQSIIDSIF